jgi:hypothetical protein
MDFKGEVRASGGSRPNRWVRLDKAWAKRLGVTRDGSGAYRIRSRELALRLLAEQQETRSWREAAARATARPAA